MSAAAEQVARGERPKFVHMSSGSYCARFWGHRFTVQPLADDGCLAWRVLHWPLGWSPPQDDTGQAVWPVYEHGDITGGFGRFASLEEAKAAVRAL